MVEQASDCVFSRAFFLTGATASGKTSLGVAAAQALCAQIVSMDSMAIYRGLDVGSAKPTLEERGGVCHYLLDVASPSENFSLVRYLQLAEEATRTIESSGHTALFVGGTPLYLKSILYGVFEAPSASEQLREELRRFSTEHGAMALWEELRKVDAVSAERLHPNDVKRVSRALEVYRTTGQCASQLQQQFNSAPRVALQRVFILTWEREKLYERINRRVDLMLEQGLVEETRALFTGTERLGKTASQAIGYREIWQALCHERTMEDAVETIKRLTRNFAKRQETWFRSLEAQGAQRIDATDRDLSSLTSELLEKIATIRT